MTTRNRRRNVWSISIWVKLQLIHFAERVLGLKITVHHINLVEPGLILRGPGAISWRFFKGRVCPTGPPQGMQACSSSVKADAQMNEMGHLAFRRNTCFGRFL